MCSTATNDVLDLNHKFLFAGDPAHRPPCLGPADATTHPHQLIGNLPLMATESSATIRQSFTKVPPPRWARWAAHAVPLIVLPSSLWRLAMAAGLPVGYSEEVLLTDYDIPGIGYLILPMITVAGEAAALLTLGLVSHWGLVAPRWIPVIGGRPVHPMAAVVPAAVGAVVLTLVTFSQLMLWNTVDEGTPTGAHRAVMGWCYAPLLLWGPLLAVVTVNYHLRRRRESEAR
jgi:hypothetical protein